MSQRALWLAPLAMVLLATSTAQAFDVEVLRENGEPSGRIDLVILGDGYRAQDQEQLSQDATALIDAFFQESPYDRYAGFYNVKLIHVMSNERGGDRGTYGAERDTALGARYFCNNTERLICVNQGVVLQIAREHVPDFDFAFVIVNDPKYGGSGGTVGVASIHNAANDIAIHEFGHQLTGLADEYQAPFPGFPACPPSDCREPNVTNRTERAEIKWRHFFEDNTPIPTPDDLRGVVGAYEGARYVSTGVYRPEHDCMMRSLGQPFCAVCREATALAQYNRVSPVESFSPSESPLIGNADQITFTIAGPTIELEDDVAIFWRLGEEIVAEGVPELTLEGGALGNGVHEVSVLIEDTSPFIGADPEGLAQQTLSWTLTINDPPELLTQTIMVREDEPATFTVEANDPEGQPLTWRLTQPPTLGEFETFDTDTGEVVFRPGPDLNGEDTFGVAVSDGFYDREAEVRLSIEPINDPPQADDLEITLDEDTAQTFALLAFDPDDDDTLTLAELPQPEHGSIEVGEDLMLTYQPEADFHGEDAFTYQITDGTLTSEPANITINITPTPDPPRITAPEAERFTFFEGETSEIQFQATDPEGDEIEFDSENLPSGAALSPEGFLSWSPVWTDIGEHNLTIRATDGTLDEQKDLTIIVEIVDEDADGLARSLEEALGLDADNADTDNDNIPDGVEVGEGPEASDVDGDGTIDALDDDSDNDGRDDLTETSEDTDGDGIGDWRDTDSDDDTVLDAEDNCPLTPNPNQIDSDDDGSGDACSPPPPLSAQPEDEGCGCNAIRPSTPGLPWWVMVIGVVMGLVIRTYSRRC